MDKRTEEAGRDEEVKTEREGRQMEWREVRRPAKAKQEKKGVRREK